MRYNGEPMANPSKSIALSPNQLLAAVDQLEPADLKPFISRAIAHGSPTHRSEPVRKRNSELMDELGIEPPPVE